MNLIKYDPKEFYKGSPFYHPDDIIPPVCTRCGCVEIFFGLETRGSIYSRKRFWQCTCCNHKSYGPVNPMLEAGNDSYTSKYHQSDSLKNILPGTKEWWFISHANKHPDGNFANELTSCLVQSGIRVFNDGNEMFYEKEKDVSSTLAWALEGAYGAIVLSSENYLLSEWCMIELDYLLNKRARSSLNLIEVRLPWSTHKREGKFTTIPLVEAPNPSSAANQILNRIKEDPLF